MIKLSDTGSVTIRIATTGRESGDTWTIFPYFDDDPTLEKFSLDDREMIKSLSISDSDATGNTDLDKKAEAVARLVRNLSDLEDYRISVKGIETESDALAKLLEQEYGLKDKGREPNVTTESKS